MDGPAYLCFYLTSRDNKRAGQGEEKKGTELKRG